MRGISIIEMRFECAVSRIEQHFFRISFAANLFSDDSIKNWCAMCVCVRVGRALVESRCPRISRKTTKMGNNNWLKFNPKSIYIEEMNL